MRRTYFWILAGLTLLVLGFVHAAAGDAYAALLDTYLGIGVMLVSDRRP